MLDISDCIAMSEDGDWIAYPRTRPDGSTITRGNVMHGLACMVGDWATALRCYRIFSGHVQPTDDPEPGWWAMCNANEPDAVPAWIATDFA